MTSLVLPLLDIDPNIVRPGWTPLIITILLAAVLVFLFLSMRRQFSRIQLPDDAERHDTDPGAPPGRLQD